MYDTFGRPGAIEHEASGLPDGFIGPLVCNLRQQ